jgi:colicin import membrane protein
MFCGVGPVPKKKTRGTANYCYEHSQVRYYGKVAVDPKLLERVKLPPLQPQLFKQKKLEQRALGLIKKAKQTKMLMEHPNATEKDIKRFTKEMEGLSAARDKLHPKLVKQIKIVEDLKRRIKQEEEAQKARDKADAEKLKKARAAEAEKAKKAEAAEKAKRAAEKAKKASKSKTAKKPTKKTKK